MDGRDGVPGEPGLDGIPGRNGLDGMPGTNGLPGRNGTNGTPGANGYNGEFLQTKTIIRHTSSSQPVGQGPLELTTGPRILVKIQQVILK